MDSLCACLDYPQVVFDGVYHNAKYSRNRRSTFDNMQVLIFNEFGLKMLIHAAEMFLVGFDSKWGAA